MSPDAGTNIAPIADANIDTGKSPRDTLRSIGNVVISAAVENSLSDIDK